MHLDKHFAQHPSQLDFESGVAIMLDKPLEWTSFDVVSKVRNCLRRFVGHKMKVGHAGTLDPLASGLLILCIGKATKRIEDYQGLAKEYSGKMMLGATTPSYDSETAVDNTYETDHITSTDIEEARKSFIGQQKQIPPIFSAIKKDGVRLYHQARKGKVVDPTPRIIDIHSFDINATEFPELAFSVTCSKGTYIRSLAFDFGKALESGGHLTALRREAIGEFRVEDAWSIEGFQAFLETA